METHHPMELPMRDVILSMLNRQPCTIRQIADYCSSNRYEISRYLSEMSRQGLIMVQYINGQIVVSGSQPMSN